MMISEKVLGTDGHHELPQGWRRVRLGDVCRTTSGGTPPRGNSTYYGGDIPWVKSGELNDGIVTRVGEHITEKAIKDSSAKIFPAGTLLIAMYGATVGKLGILDMDAATNQAVCAVTVGETVDRDYLFYFLLGERERLVALSFGGAQPNISQDIVRNVGLLLPPIPEQQRISALLSQKLAAVDTARAAAEAQLSAIKQLPASYLRAAFSGAADGGFTENDEGLRSRTS